MKYLIFDSSSIISITMNSLLPLLFKLKEKFKGKFIITEQVKREMVDVPLKIKRFALEAFMIKEAVDKGILEIITPKEEKIREVINAANNIFFCEGKPIKIIHIGEASCIALSKQLKEKGEKNMLVIDERTTRLLCENPFNLKNLLERKLHKRIALKYSEYFSQMNIVRSSELMAYALMNKIFELRNEKKELMQAILYSLKFKGCAISDKEIEQAKRMVK